MEVHLHVYSWVCCESTLLTSTVVHTLLGSIVESRNSRNREVSPFMPSIRANQAIKDPPAASARKPTEILEQKKVNAAAPLFRKTLSPDSGLCCSRVSIMVEIMLDRAVTEQMAALPYGRSGSPKKYWNDRSTRLSHIRARSPFAIQLPLLEGCPFRRRTSRRVCMKHHYSGISNGMLNKPEDNPQGGDLRIR